MKREVLLDQFVDLTKSMMKAWKAELFAHIGDSNLSFAQVGIMMALQRHEPCSQRELADDLDISRSAVTQMLEGLIENGFVYRQDDPNDRRISKLALSASGTQMVRELDKLRKQFFGRLTRDLSDEELIHFISLNQKIINTLNN